MRGFFDNSMFLEQPEKGKHILINNSPMDFDLWNKYVNDDDPDNEKNMTRSEHAKYSIEEKLQLLINYFGKEK